jgi:hypothetical protein
VERITVKSGAIEIQVVNRNSSEEERSGHDLSDDGAKDRSILVVPWPTTVQSSVKGILHSPSPTLALSGNRDRVLTAIARARAWIQDLVDGRTPKSQNEKARSSGTSGCWHRSHLFRRSFLQRLSMERCYPISL